MRCEICERGCNINLGKTGACGRYVNDGGQIVECHPNRYLLTCPISVETIPLLHFYPGSAFLQVSTVGCNFNCPGCIATVTAREMRPDSPALRYLGPDAVVNMAIKQNCHGIAFLMNDPLASYHTFCNLAKAAHDKGLKVGCATNGYFTEASLEPLLGLLDCVNIGVKGINKKNVVACGGADPEVVLRNIRFLHAYGTHVEVACMERADNREDTRMLAEMLADISPSMVLQLMRYMPFEDADPKLEPSITSTETFAKELRSILPFTYVFNTPGTRGLDTCCPVCGETVIVRDFYGPMGARLIEADEEKSQSEVRCGRCGANVAISGAISPPELRERDFKGGYPFTRGLEIIESMCLSMGAATRAEVVAVWEHLLANGQLHELHHGIQNIDGYFGLIRQFGKVLGKNTAARQLVEYLSELVAPVLEGVARAAPRPRTYYAMGKPLFALKSDRFENYLVETAGGQSVNTSLAFTGRPGVTIAAEALRQSDPEVIFISSFISNEPKAFCAECQELDLDVQAVRSGSVYTPTIPASDFGAPKWVLGLRFLANKLHPEIFNFDIEADAHAYHLEVFGQDFPLDSINRSFAKPSRFWRFSDI